MKRGNFLIGGRVVFAESTAPLGPMFAINADVEQMIEGEQTNPAHVIVGTSGYHSDPREWPKPGLYCQACLVIVVKVGDR
jgi:hypothetical protein